MKHKEYIIPIGEEAKEFDEIFIGVIRKQPELIRCRDCKWHKEKRCTVWRERAVIVECYTDDDGFCYLGEPND